MRWQAAFAEAPALSTQAFVNYYNGGYNGSFSAIKPCRGGNAWPPQASVSSVDPVASDAPE